VTGYASQTLSKTISQLPGDAKAGLLTVATYHQAAVSIAKMHIPSIPAWVNLNYPINENDTYLRIARQTRHGIQTLRSDYGRDCAYPC
jgi:superfamily I DNA/RNA helicase